MFFYFLFLFKKKKKNVPGLKSGVLKICHSCFLEEKKKGCRYGEHFHSLSTICRQDIKPEFMLQLWYIRLILLYVFQIGKWCSDSKNFFFYRVAVSENCKGKLLSCSWSGKVPVSELAPLSSSNHMVMFCFS